MWQKISEIGQLVLGSHCLGPRSPMRSLQSKTLFGREWKDEDLMD